jgi:polyisoprenoid-binding protein YceI
MNHSRDRALTRRLDCRLLASLLLLPTVLPAQARHWTLDPAASRVEFTIANMVIRSTTGVFHDVEGSLTTTDEAMQTFDLDVAIATASVDTDHPDRDAHLRREDILDVANYPTMRYTAERARREGDAYIVEGELELHGVRRPVPLTATLVGRDAGSMRWSATAEINRRDFGINFNGTDFVSRLSRTVPMAGDEVAIALTLTFRAVGAADAATAATRILGTLDAATRAAVLKPFAGEARGRWRRSPAPRSGVRIADLPAAARPWVDSLLASALSAQGVASALRIIASQDSISAEEGIGSAWYWLEFYGDPGQGWWAWRLGGHHLSLHASYEDRHLTAVTPMLLAWERVRGLDEPAGLRRRRGSAMALRRSLDQAQQRLAVVADVTPPELELDERRRQMTPDTLGVPLARLSASQQALARQLIGSTLEEMHPTAAEAWRRQIDGASPEAIRFSWAGPVDPETATWYAITGPTFRLEGYGSADHAHHILRSTHDP